MDNLSEGKIERLREVCRILSDAGRPVLVGTTCSGFETGGLVLAKTFEALNERFNTEVAVKTVFAAGLHQDCFLLAFMFGEDHKYQKQVCVWRTCTQHIHTSAQSLQTDSYQELFYLLYPPPAYKHVYTSGFFVVAHLPVKKKQGGTVDRHRERDKER